MRNLLIFILLVNILTSCIVVKPNRKRPRHHRHVVDVPYKSPERRYLGR